MVGGRSREAWLAAIAAALGCRHDADVAARPAPDPDVQAPAASASESTPAPAVSTAATASASSAPVVTTSTAYAGLLSVLGPGPTDLSDAGVLGIGVGATHEFHNQSCGASSLRYEPTDHPDVQIAVQSQQSTDQAAFIRARARLLSCVRRSQADAGLSWGTVQAIVTVNASGAVTDVTAFSPNAIAPALMTCMKDVLRGVRLDASTSERTVHVGITLDQRRY